MYKLWFGSCTTNAIRRTLAAHPSCCRCRPPRRRAQLGAAGAAPHPAPTRAAGAAASAIPRAEATQTAAACRGRWLGRLLSTCCCFRGSAWRAPPAAAAPRVTWGMVRGAGRGLCDRERLRRVQLDGWQRRLMRADPTNLLLYPHLPCQGCRGEGAACEAGEASSACSGDAEAAGTAPPGRALAWACCGMGSGACTAAKPCCRCGCLCNCGWCSAPPTAAPAAATAAGTGARLRPACCCGCCSRCPYNDCSMSWLAASPSTGARSAAKLAARFASTPPPVAPAAAAGRSPSCSCAVKSADPKMPLSAGAPLGRAWRAASAAASFCCRGDGGACRRACCWCGSGSMDQASELEAAAAGTAAATCASNCWPALSGSQAG